MKRLLSTKPLNTDLATLILRLMFGGLFIYYGYLKLMGMEQYLPMFPDLIGIGGKLSYILVTIAELIGGFFILIGLATRFSVLPITFSMTIAYFLAHKNDAFEVKQIVLVFLILTIVIFILGSGRYSLDRLLIKNKK